VFLTQQTGNHYIFLIDNWLKILHIYNYHEFCWSWFKSGI